MVTRDGSVPPVLICGLPSSGNSLLLRIVRSAMRAAGATENWAGVLAVVHHGIEGDLNGERAYLDLANLVRSLTNKTGRAPSVIVPVRSVAPWRLSCRERFPQDWEAWERNRAESRGVVFRVASEFGLSVLPVSYEGLVAWPEETIADVLEFAGLPVPPDVEPIYDGNARRLAEKN